MRVILLLLLSTAIAEAQLLQSPSSSPTITEVDVLGDIISQQAKFNARLMVQLNTLQSELVREKARAEAAEAKLKKE
jgi:hypothetical protein